MRANDVSGRLDLKRFVASTNAEQPRLNEPRLLPGSGARWFLVKFKPLVTSGSKSTLLARSMTGAVPSAPANCPEARH
jgi:hypothetical protein